MHPRNPRVLFFEGFVLYMLLAPTNRLKWSPLFFFRVVHLNDTDESMNRKIFREAF